MADLQTSTTNGKRRLGNPKVDLTPMVDLGFLLITFFVFTSAMASQKAMRVWLPANGPETPIGVTGAVTLLPTGDKIWLYEGTGEDGMGAMQGFLYTKKDDLRQKLMAIKKLLVAKNGNDDKLMVMIKPGNGAGFGQVVSVLDEMTICSIKRYAILDITPKEEAQIRAGK